MLTEPSRFDGSLDDLATGCRALSALSVPAMRKDFLVDAYQVLEGRAAGASGVLAILRMIPRAELEALIDTALEPRHVRIARGIRCVRHRAGAPAGRARLAHRELLLVGVNSRDLTTLQVVPGRLDALAASLPDAGAARGRKRRRHGRGRRAGGCRWLRPGTGGQCTHVVGRTGAAGGCHARRRTRGSGWRAQQAAGHESAFHVAPGRAFHQALRHDHRRGGARSADLRSGCHWFRVRFLGARGQRGARQ